MNGVEIFDSGRHEDLPDYMECMRPDYSLYPKIDFAISMTTRGCPRGCSFCVVGCKEGLVSRQVADVADFYIGQPKIHVMDPNILACAEKHKLLRDYLGTGAIIIFNQGLDIRLIDDEDISIINKMRFKDAYNLHFAWDNPNEDLSGQFKMFADRFRLKRKGMVLILTNFGSTPEQDMYRIRKTYELGFDPYVMIYNKPDAPRVTRHLQRWCNNKILFKSCTFDEYLATRTTR